MSTDPFVAPRIEDRPRQQQNLAPGVSLPPVRQWTADRPGDEVMFGQPRGELFGFPGPNIGYALTLAHRIEKQLALAPHEHLADALAVTSELAMKRAASYGRAPVMADVECAASVLGYLGGAPPELAKWRASVVDGAHESYSRRRAVCDAVDLDALRLVPKALSERLPEVRDALRRTYEQEQEQPSPT